MGYRRFSKRLRGGVIISCVKVNLKVGVKKY